MNTCEGSIDDFKTKFEPFIRPDWAPWSCSADWHRRLCCTPARSSSGQHGSYAIGRISRDGITPDWSFQKAFPGTINPTIAYHYETISLFVPNWFSYLQITIDSNNTNILGSIYDTSYNPKPGSAEPRPGRQLPGRPGRQRKLFRQPAVLSGGGPDGGQFSVGRDGRPGFERDDEYRYRAQFTSRRVGGGLLRYRFRRSDTRAGDFHAPGSGATGAGRTLSPSWAGIR